MSSRRLPTRLWNGLPQSSRKLLRWTDPPSWITPTLATLVHETFSDADWLFEPKLDGERCVIFKRDGGVWLMSRNEKELNDTYPEIVAAFEAQHVDDLIVDGEIVTFVGRKTSFARLQERMQLSDPAQARRSGVDVHCYLFDVMRVAGYDTTALPLRDRKRVLGGALRYRDPVRLTPYRNREGTDYYRRACRAGWEGVLAKDATSAYAEGRSRTWLKFKCVNSQEFVVGGYTEPAGTRSGIGALLIGYYEGDKLRYAGKVGTGFSEDELRHLRDMLVREERRESPFAEPDAGERGAHWVAPTLVADIEFTEWTGDGKLRHPRYVGLRRDKDPAYVVREQPS